MPVLAPVQPSRAAAAVAWPTSQWCEFFRDKALLDIPWHFGCRLTDAELEVLGPSLQVFQQGESQEGGHFYRVARAHAEADGDFDYAEAHRLFMEEERRHGRDLARYLRLAGVPVRTEPSLLARAFCWCGSRGGLEPTLLVILMSELIALVYYAAVRRASGCLVLRRLCEQILCDEQQHVRFQCERLAILRRQRRGLRLALTRMADRCLFAGAALACWCGHRRALRAGGLGLIGFWRSGWRAFRAAARQADPRRYQSV